MTVDGVYTNKAPGGVAYRCSFRVTEAAYLIERLIDVLAYEARHRVPAGNPLRKNFIKKDQFPYDELHSAGIYDSGDYHDVARSKAHRDAVGYDEIMRREQKDEGPGRRPSSWAWASRPSRRSSAPGRLEGIRHRRPEACSTPAELRVHPTGKAILKPRGARAQGQGHETTFAQIVANELGIPPEDIAVEVTAIRTTAPYGLGTYGSRSTPVAGAACAVAARKIRAKAQKIAAHLLEVGEDDLEWEVDRFKVKGLPERFSTMKDVCMAAYSTNLPEGLEPGLETTSYYDPPNFTYPFGAYICVVDIDRFTGEVAVRRFYALDDCGTRINPMVIEGQVHGGLAEAYAIAMGQEIVFDETGNVLGASFQDYFIPTAVETPVWETDHTVTPSPHHPIGAKGVGESPNVGGVPAFSNAIVDAFAQHGVTHTPMPHTPWRVWQTLDELGLNR